MFFSARRRERLGRGTGGHWTTGVTAGTATATGARVCGVNTHSSSSLSDSESVTSGRDDGGSAEPQLTRDLSSQRQQQRPILTMNAADNPGQPPAPPTLHSLRPHKLRRFSSDEGDAAEESCSQRQSCNGVEWSKDRTQAAESVKWRPQQAYGSNQVLLSQPQTIFSTPKILMLTHK